MNSQIAMERISYVAKPDSITASQGDFLATHVAIKRLLLLDKFDVMPSGGKHYMEEEIFKRYIKSPQNQHQFIVVYGQSGTGKSHLIRWFEARYSQHKPDDEVVLFIRRSDNTLKGTIRQLLEKPERN
jgi:chromosomal replication initiation ATPase DnaA